MKKLNLLIGILTGFIIFSCSPDENNSKINNNSIKKLIQFTSDKYSFSYEQLTFNIIYDINDNLSGTRVIPTSIIMAPSLIISAVKN